MSKTTDNLKAAFAGESQANRKYLAFAKKAEAEGFPRIARLFRAAAHAETIHAHNHLAALDGIRTTAENLAEAVGGENYEVVSMYPPMLAAAEEETQPRAARSFRFALAVEKDHEALYRQAADLLAAGQDGVDTQYYVCPVCGYTHAGPMTERCPVCGAAPEKFEHIA